MELRNNVLCHVCRLFSKRLGWLQIWYNCVLVANVGSGPIPFPKRDWKTINPLAQDLIQRCLVIEPSKRITAAQALTHPWLTEQH